MFAATPPNKGSPRKRPSSSAWKKSPANSPRRGPRFTRKHRSYGTYKTYHQARLPSKNRKLPRTPLLPQSGGHIRLHLSFLREVPQTRRPHDQPDGAGCPLRQTEHRRRQQSLTDLDRNRNQAHQRRPGESRRTPHRLQRLPPRPRPTALG